MNAWFESRVSVGPSPSPQKWVPNERAQCNNATYRVQSCHLALYHRKRQGDVWVRYATWGACWSLKRWRVVEIHTYGKSANHNKSKVTTQSNPHVHLVCALWIPRRKAILSPTSRRSEGCRGEPLLPVMQVLVQGLGQVSVNLSFVKQPCLPIPNFDYNTKIKFSIKLRLIAILQTWQTRCKMVGVGNCRL